MRIERKNYLVCVSEKSTAMGDIWDFKTLIRNHYRAITTKCLHTYIDILIRREFIEKILEKVKTVA